MVLKDGDNRPMVRVLTAALAFALAVGLMLPAGMSWAFASDDIEGEWEQLDVNSGLLSVDDAEDNAESGDDAPKDVSLDSPIEDDADVPDEEGSDESNRDEQVGSADALENPVTVKFGTTSTVTVEAWSTLTADQVPEVRSFKYTIEEGIAKGTAVLADFRGWLKVSSVDSVLDVSGRHAFALTDDMLIVNKCQDINIVDSMFFDLSASITGDMSFIKLYTADAFSVSVNCTENTYKLDGLDFDLGYVPSAFEITEAMVSPYKDEAQKKFGDEFEPIGFGWQWRAGSSTHTTTKFPLAIEDDTTFIMVFQKKLPDSLPVDPSGLLVVGDTGVKASGNLSGPNIPDGSDIEVHTSAVTSGDAYDELDSALGPNRISDVFEIKLMVDGKEVHDEFGQLRLSLPVDAKYNGHVIVIYHRHQDGTITMTRSVAIDGYVDFVVTDLSSFALADGGFPQAPSEPSGNLGSLAQTGDSISVNSLIALIAIAASSAFTMLLFMRKPRGRHCRR